MLPVPCFSLICHPMKNLVYILLLAVFALAASSCIKETNTEEEQPKVELLSPLPCDTLRFGEAFTYRVKITDNTGLGNISMDLHHNFGHHNHGAHETCSFGPVKDAVDPYSDNWVFALPENELEHVYETQLSLPAMKNDSTSYDEGDYHFHIYVTDNDGYQVFTTLDLKIMN